MQRFNRISKLKDTIDSAAEKAQDVSRKAADAAASAGERAQVAAEKSLDATASAASKVTDAAASAGEKAQDAAEKTLDATTSAASGTIEQLKAAYGKGLDTVFPECPVTAFMLPTGPDAEDYVMVFDLDDVIENLISGIFVRPKLEVWAGRTTGFDLDRLGQTLKNDFVRQFNDVREIQIRVGEAAINDLEAGKNLASQELGQTATSSVLRTTAGVGLVSAGFIFWPLLPLGLVFIALGIGSVSQLVGLIPDYLSASAEKRRTQRRLDRDLKKLEAQFDSKNATFQRAVRSIEVKVHPRIETLTSLICDIERVASPPASSTPVDVPDVGPYLHHDMYLKQFPAVYRRLLEVC